MVNERGKVVDVSGGSDTENRNIIVWKRHNGLNQQWDIVYKDAMKPEPKKGQLNRYFGLYVERNFHVVSRLGKRRYLDIINRNLVIKTPNGFKT